VAALPTVETRLDRYEEQLRDPGRAVVAVAEYRGPLLLRRRARVVDVRHHDLRSAVRIAEILDRATAEVEDRTNGSTEGHTERIDRMLVVGIGEFPQHVVLRRVLRRVVRRRSRNVQRVVALAAAA